VIADSQLRAGGSSTHIRDHGPEVLLRRYLRLIRRARNQQRHRTIALRRADVEALAQHLGWTDDAVLTRLAELMGTTRRQRARMLALLATGASLITVAGPTVANAASMGDDGQRVALDDTPVVIIADHLSLGSRPGSEHAARLALADEPIAKPITGSSDRSARHAPVLEAQHRRGATPVATARVERQRRTESTPPDAAVAEIGQRPELDVATDRSGNPDGNDVAVGEPPIPPAVDPDGNYVAVGDPPIPPAVDLDGNRDVNRVAVGDPPIPPAVDDDGNYVAVGEPPVPPSDSDETAVEAPIEP
jgi:hypothetical protein